MKRAVCAFAMAASAHVAAAEPEVLSYHLEAIEVAPDTYVFEGVNEDFLPGNGGKLANTGFIVTSAGVVVIDTGPSRLYGEEMRAAIRVMTDQPIAAVFITHHHPDHCLGNQAFPEATITALAATTSALQALGEQLEQNMYRLLGAWMRNTDLQLPSQVAASGVREFGNHRLQLIGEHGHTGGDLVIHDQTTGVVFAGDLIFNGRAPTVPDATPSAWLASLERLQQLDFKVLVPGHGPIARDHAPLERTRDYLVWLEETLRSSAEEGLDMIEVMQLPIPARFTDLKVLNEEYPRSVAQRFPLHEQRALGELR